MAHDRHPRLSLGEALTESLNDVGAEVVTTVLAPGVHQRGKVSQSADRIEAARHAGWNAIKYRNME